MVLEVNLGTYALLFCLVGGQMAVLLWAGGAAVGLTAPTGRLVAGAAVGALHAVLVDLAGFGVLPGAGWLGVWHTVLAVSLVAFAIVYWPLPAGRLWPALGAYYFLSVLGAGAGYALYNLGLHGWAPPLAATAVILLAAQLGWGVVQRWVWERVVYLPLEVELLGRTVRVTALLDTGNHLVDPLTREPVVILGAELAGRLLPEEGVAAVTAAAANPVDGVTMLSETPLASRVRLVPYSTLGRENGLLVAFRADAVRLFDGAEGLAGPTALVAFHGQPLDPSGLYQALVHPALVRSALARSSRSRGRLVVGAGVTQGGTVSRRGG
jgi:stage II sporulation protein GA (sporulation sigma-E factor processing peptidase)